MAQRDYLLDTTTLSVFSRLKSGRRDTQCDALSKKLDQLPPDAKLFLCPICVGEMERGARIAPNPAILSDIRSAISSFKGVLPIDEKVASECYSELWARLFNHYAAKDKRVGAPEKIRRRELLSPTHSYDMQVQENDLWLTAVAMYHKLILVTHDKMERLRSISKDDVQFEDWLKQ